MIIPCKAPIFLLFASFLPCLFIPSFECGSSSSDAYQGSPLPSVLSNSSFPFLPVPTITFRLATLISTLFPFGSVLGALPPPDLSGLVSVGCFSPIYPSAPSPAECTGFFKLPPRLGTPYLSSLKTLLV